MKSVNFVSKSSFPLSLWLGARALALLIVILVPPATVVYWIFMPVLYAHGIQSSYRRVKASDAKAKTTAWVVVVPALAILLYFLWRPDPWLLSMLVLVIFPIHVLLDEQFHAFRTPSWLSWLEILAVFLAMMPLIPLVAWPILVSQVFAVLLLFFVFIFRSVRKLKFDRPWWHALVLVLFYVAIQGRVPPTLVAGVLNYMLFVHSFDWYSRMIYRPNADFKNSVLEIGAFAAVALGLGVLGLTSLGAPLANLFTFQLGSVCLLAHSLQATRLSDFRIR